MPTLSLDGTTLWYDTVGSGPPLVLVHGGWQNSESWRRQIDYFAADFSVVTFDLRGHGKTGATDAGEYSIDLFVDDLERLLAQLEIETPIFGGVSIGGIVIQSYLERHPTEARGVVIGGPLQSMPPIDLGSGVKSLLSPLPAISGLVSTVGATATFRSFLNSIRVANGGAWLTVDSAVRSQAMDAVREFSHDEYLKVFRALYEFVPPDLSHVETPLLILYGDHEVAQGKRQGERLSTTVANGSWQEIPDAGHLVNQDKPEAFNAACSEFFARLDRKESTGD